MAGGRPLKFQSVEELQKKIDEYFDVASVPTITGLAVHLGTSRETLVEYAERPEYVDSIKGAKDRCERFVEEGALSGKLNSTFSIFNLKNNYGWRDKTESELYGKDGGAISQSINIEFVNGKRPDTGDLPAAI